MTESVELPARLAILPFRNKVLLPGAIIRIRCTSPSRFSTGAGVTGGSALIHDFYAREVPNPVHLTVDTAFTDEKQTIKAFVSNSLSIGDHQLAAQFQEIPLDTRMVEAERVGWLKKWHFLFTVSPHRSIFPSSEAFLHTPTSGMAPDRLL